MQFTELSTLFGLLEDENNTTGSDAILLKMFIGKFDFR